MFKIKIPFIIIVLLLFNSCAQENNRLQVKAFHSEALENSLLQVNPEKKIGIYLPPTYFESSKRYPVIYYLPGFTSPIDEIIGGEYEGFRLKNVMDELIEKKKIKEMIVVLCDGSNFLGGNFYTNSPLTGNAEDYIVNNIVNYVDTNYRTLKSSDSRGIAGHSMGGFGSFNIATKHPEIFGVCYSISPGIYSKTGLHEQGLFKSKDKLHYLQSFLKDINENGNNEDERIKELKQKIKPLFSISYESYLSAFTVAYGTAFNHDSSISFPHVEFPNRATNKENFDNPMFHDWQKEGFGDWQNKVSQRLENIRKLKAIAIDCGTEDTWITDGTKHIINILKSRDINLDTFWHNGGHDDQLHLRLKEHMLPYYSENLINDQY